MPDPIKPFTRRQRLVRQVKAIVRWRQVREAEDLSTCNYYRGIGWCGHGCWEEPACQTDMPLKGWPLAEPFFPRTQQWLRPRLRQTFCLHREERPVYGWTAEAGEQVVYFICSRCHKRLRDAPASRSQEKGEA